MEKKILDVDVNFFGKDLDINSYAECAFNWAKQNITGTFFCPCLNASVQISNKGIKHTIMHKRFDQQNNYNHETISLISVLHEMIAFSELHYTNSHKDGNEDFKSVKFLKAFVKINGEQRIVQLLIKEVYVGNKNDDITNLVFYNHVFIKKSPT